MFCNIVPSFIRRRLLRIKIGTCLPVEWTFIKHELDKLLNHLFSCLRLYCSSLVSASYLLLIFFYSRAICQQIVCNMNQKYLHSPVSKTFGPEKGDLNKHMFNYSDITFKRMRCLFSEEGWLFSSLPTKVSEDQILGEFEPLLSHLNLHKTDVYWKVFPV